MKNCKLYVIVDKGLIGGKDILEIAAKALRGGADIIQLRDKISNDRVLIEEAKALSRLVKKHNSIFIVNDRPDIAVLADADGVHLGQDDIPIKYARRLLPQKIIGISAHSLKQALRAENEGADYVGIGPVFKSTSKNELNPIGLKPLKAVKKRLAIPFFAIGGINAKHLGCLRGVGVDKIAVMSHVISSKNIYRSTRMLKEFCLHDTYRISKKRRYN